MPEIDRNAFPTMDQGLFARLKEQTGTLAAIHIDRLRVGKYKDVDLQGGMFYPAIKENREKGVVWAFNSTGVARAVAKRAADNNGFVKLVLMQEGNVIGNKTFTHIWFNDLKENIQNGLVSKSAALRELNDVRSKFAKHKNDKLATGHSKSWKTLDEAFNDIVSMPQQKRASTYFQKSKTETKSEGEKIAYQSLLSKKMTGSGFPDAIKIVEAIEEPAFKGVPSGATVGIIQIDPLSTDSPILTGKEAGVPEHLSYEYVLKGKPVAKLGFYSVVEQIAPETKGKMMSQAQVNFPIEKSIPQAAEAVGQLRFMPDYSGEHRAPQRDSGAPLDNLKDVYPDDVYGPKGALYYGHASGDATDKAAIRIIQSARNKPDAPVKVFRAIPKGIQSNEINPGDWITTIKSYAVQHGEGALGGDYKILEKTVPAGDLYTNGDSIFEFGYDPKFMPSPDSAMPGAYSFPGGYRALPGKAKGSLRLYGPAGSLIGIAASLDEAQRIIRKKSKQ
jgi:hypothetical protein